MKKRTKTERDFTDFMFVERQDVASVMEVAAAWCRAGQEPD